MHEEYARGAALIAPANGPVHACGRAGPGPDQSQNGIQGSEPPPAGDLRHCAFRPGSADWSKSISSLQDKVLCRGLPSSLSSALVILRDSWGLQRARSAVVGCHMDCHLPDFDSESRVDSDIFYASCTKPSVHPARYVP